MASYSALTQVKTCHSLCSVGVNFGDSEISVHCLDSLRSTAEPGPESNQNLFLLSFMQWAQTELQPVSGDLNPVNLNTTDSFAGNFLWNYCFIVSDFTVLRQDQHVLMDQELSIHDGSSSLPC